MDAKRPRLVGHFIRARREGLALSQRSLGLLFTPPVTTQFISNVERGVTPLPPAHVPTLARALQVVESDIMNLLEREYSQKLNERLGKAEEEGSAGLTISPNDLEFMQLLYRAYKQADSKTREDFAGACATILNLSATSKTG